MIALVFVGLEQVDPAAGCEAGRDARRRSSPQGGGHRRPTGARSRDPSETTISSRCGFDWFNDPSAGSPTERWRTLRFDALSPERPDYIL